MLQIDSEFTLESKTSFKFKEDKIEKPDSIIEFDEWYLNFRKNQQFLISISEELISSLQLRIPQLNKQNKLIIKMFQSVSTKITFDEQSLETIDEFKFKKNKKMKNFRRSIHKNNDLFDILFNFKEERNEFSKGYQENEEKLKKKIFECLNNEYLINGEKILEVNFSKFRELKAILQKTIDEFIRRYKLIRSKLEKNWLINKNNNKNEISSNLSNRDSFEILSSFFEKSSQINCSLKNLLNFSLNILKAAKIIETAHLERIVDAIKNYANGTNDFLENKKNLLFSKTTNLILKIDSKKIMNEFFSPEVLLSPENILFISTSLKTTEFNCSDFEKLIKKTTSNNFNKVFESFKEGTWRAMIYDQFENIFQATIILSKESTIIIYKYDTIKNQLGHYTTILLENCEVYEDQTKESVILKYPQKTLPINFMRKENKSLTENVKISLILTFDAINKNTFVEILKEKQNYNMGHFLNLDLLTNNKKSVETPLSPDSCKDSQTTDDSNPKLSKESV